MRLLAHICDCESVLVCKAIQSCIWLGPQGKNGRKCNPSGNCLVTRCLLANISHTLACGHGLHCTEAQAEVAANTLPIKARLFKTPHRSTSWLIIYLQLTFYKPGTSAHHTHNTHTHWMRLRLQEPLAAIWFHKYLQPVFALSFSTFSGKVYRQLKRFQ